MQIPPLVLKCRSQEKSIKIKQMEKWQKVPSIALFALLYGCMCQYPPRSRLLLPKLGVIEAVALSMPTTGWKGTVVILYGATVVTVVVDPFWKTFTRISKFRWPGMIWNPEYETASMERDLVVLLELQHTPDAAQPLVAFSKASEYCL